MNNAYSYIGTKEVTQESSSGGAFMAIAKVFFDTFGNRGRAFGVAFSEQLDVEYTIAENYENCAVFQGSKYVQADAGKAIKQAIDCLKSGMSVLFVGTPCMVAALKKLAEDGNLQTDNLWLVDLICHGTVDKTIWKDYLSWIEKRHGAKVTDYSFRYKNVAWRGYPVYIKLSNGTEIIDTYEARAYIRAFLKAISIREACFTCRYKTTDRCGDLTLGDFWGAEAVLDVAETLSGVSLILVNTDKGAHIAEKVGCAAQKDGASLRELSEVAFMYRQDNLQHALTKPQEYALFRETYKKCGFEAAIRKTGIFTVGGQIRALGICVLKKTGMYHMLKRIRDRRHGH